MSYKQAILDVAVTIHVTGHNVSKEAYVSYYMHDAAPGHSRGYATSVVREGEEYILELQKLLKTLRTALKEEPKDD